MTKEKRDKLNEAVMLCTMHSERLRFARAKMIIHFPLEREKYVLLPPETLSFFDQMIYRFSKLQDSMGGKLFPAILENLGEEIISLPFIDRLTKLEQLEILPDAEEWMMLRETRNMLTHEYPFVTDEVIEGLNLLNKHCLLILEIWEKINHYIQNRFVS